MLRYAALRLILLVVVGGVLYLFGMRDVLLFATTIIVSALAAYAILPKQRDDAAKKLAKMASAGATRKANARPDADSEYEDSVVDDYLDKLGEKPGDEDETKRELD